MKSSSSTVPQWLLSSDSSVFPASNNSPLSVQAFDNLKEGKITINWFWYRGKSSSIPKAETISLAINIMIESFHDWKLSPRGWRTVACNNSRHPMWCHQLPPRHPWEPRHRNSELFQYDYFIIKYWSQDASPDRSDYEVWVLNFYTTLPLIFVKD